MGLQTYPTGSRKFVIFNGAICKKATLEPIPPEEPIFIVRGRDKFALWLLRLHLFLCWLDRATDWQISLNKETITEFKEFRRKYPERMKQPGVTLGK